MWLEKAGVEKNSTWITRLQYDYMLFLSPGELLLKVTPVHLAEALIRLWLYQTLSDIKALC